MNIAFIYASITIEKVNNRYYHNFLNDIISRYSQFGSLAVCVSMEEKNSSNLNEINFSSIKFIEVKKENNIRNRINRQHNRRAIKKVVEKCDLLIVHIPDSVGDMGARYAKKLRKPFLAVVIGCVWDSLWNHSWKGKLLATSAFFNMKRTVWEANYVIYVTCQFLQNRYPTAGKNIGCSDVVIEENNENICLKRKERFTYLNKSDKIKVATIGSLDVSYKGQRYIIRALKTLLQDGWNYHYYLIGGGEGKALLKLAKELGVEDHIHYLGVLKHSDINECLMSMDIYAQPSRQEGLPRAVVEAMNVGLPCIGSNVGGIPELLPQELIFDEGNVAGIVKLLEVTPCSWCKYVDYSFNKVKEYDSKILDNRRNDFFKMIVSEILKE